MTVAGSCVRRRDGAASVAPAHALVEITVVQVKLAPSRGSRATHCRLRAGSCAEAQHAHWTTCAVAALVEKIARTKEKSGNAKEADVYISNILI